MTTAAIANRPASRPGFAAAPLAGRAITRVMIVDDNPEIHLLLTARLEARGFIVRSASDGEEALAQFQDFRPDIAFLDVTMPRFGGLDVLQVIRAENLDMAVVLTAPMGMEQMAINALRHGADDYLRKPFDGAEFQAALDRTFTRLTLARQNTALRKHLGIQLARAGEAQAELLPQADPQVSGFELAARCIPAGEGEVGGDFYDWQELRPSTLSLTVGDVMGKGVPAALMMATVRAVMRALAPQNAPGAALQEAARTLEPDLNRSQSFVTVFHAQLDLASARLSYSDAGHGFVLFLRADGTVEDLRHVGLPLGIRPGEVYVEDTVLLGPGDMVIVYSDGLAEVLPELVGNGAALAALVDPAESAACIADRLVAIARAAGPLVDDLTIAVLRRGLREK
ncbi:MAG TPA: SpoIIE family protein phosphatase [Vicinamibacterales bacterium]|nr:SpoIIE family protein phosphatase [Vicinamibacterales bacterium]